MNEYYLGYVIKKSKEEIKLYYVSDNRGTILKTEELYGETSDLDSNNIYGAIISIDDFAYEIISCANIESGFSSLYKLDKKIPNYIPDFIKKNTSMLYHFATQVYNLKLEENEIL